MRKCVYIVSGFVQFPAQFVIVNYFLILFVAGDTAEINFNPHGQLLLANEKTEEQMRDNYRLQSQVFLPPF